MPKKKFIDKKNSTTFQLVHRSQKDPLITDDKAPKRILHPIREHKKERNDELEKYGIYFDDDYDYLQHLKPVSSEACLVEVKTSLPIKKESSKICLPSSVFESHVEETVGMLNKSAPKSGLDLSLDPDIVAAMDSDYEPGSSDEEFFDDNFISKLNGIKSDDNEVSSDDMTSEDECSDDLGSIPEFDTKSRFTEYSMTSSVIRRNEQLRLLDDKFEKMFESYDDNEIGALDCDEIEGFIDPENQTVQSIMDEFEKTQITSPLVTLPNVYESFSESSDSEHSLAEVKEKERWDCESILSTYSDIYNHPKLIEFPLAKIKINPRTGIPETKKKLTAKALKELNNSTEGEKSIKKASGPGSLVSMVSLLSVRPKDESSAEKAERKKSFKLYKKARRIEKKNNSQAFKEETLKMKKMMAHNKSNHIVKV